MGFDTEKHNKAVEEALVAIGFTSKVFKLKTIVENNFNNGGEASAIKVFYIWRFKKATRMLSDNQIEKTFKTELDNYFDYVDVIYDWPTLRIHVWGHHSF